MLRLVVSVLAKRDVSVKSDALSDIQVMDSCFIVSLLMVCAVPSSNLVCFHRLTQP